MRPGPAIAIVALLLAQAPAWGQIYKCENADGVIEYSNAPPAPQSGRNCKAVQLQPITSVPAPKLPVKAAPGAAPGGDTKTAAARPPGSEGFPKIEPATQKARDSDRKRILEDELAKEESRLGELRKEYNNGEPERLGGERNYQKYLDRVQRLKEDITRSEANVASIKRELAGAKP